MPAVKRIGLLLKTQRMRFDELGILQYENWEDPFESLKAAEAEMEAEKLASIAPPPPAN